MNERTSTDDDSMNTDSILYELFKDDHRDILTTLTSLWMEPNDTISLGLVCQRTFSMMLKGKEKIGSWFTRCVRLFATRRLREATKVLEHDLIVNQGLEILLKPITHLGDDKDEKCCLLTFHKACIAGGYPLQFVMNPTAFDKDTQDRVTKDIDIFYSMHPKWDVEHRQQVTRILQFYKTLEEELVKTIYPDHYTYTNYSEFVVDINDHQNHGILHHTIFRKGVDRNNTAFLHLDLCCIKCNYYASRSTNRNVTPSPIYYRGVLENPMTDEMVLERIVDHFDLSCCKVWYTPDEGIRCIDGPLGIWNICRNLTTIKRKRFDTLSNNPYLKSFLEKYSKKGFFIKVI